MKKIIAKISNWIFVGSRHKQELQERRFDWLLTQLYCCSTHEHLLSFYEVKERVLQPEDYLAIRYIDLKREINMIEAFISGNEARMKELRIEYADYLLRQHGIK